VLPILAILGLVYLFDFGGSESDSSEPNEPNPNFNREEFGETDDVATGTDVVDFLFLNGGDDVASGGAGDDAVFLGAGQDATVVLADDGSFETTGMEGDDLIRGGEGRDVLVDTLGSNTIYGDVGYDRINVVDDATSDETPDTVFGGFGNDAIFSDGGDVVTGGGGDDRFQLIADASDAPVIITDYEEGDTFLLRDPDRNLIVQERITFAIDEDGENTNMQVDGETVAILQGVTETPVDALANFPAPPIFGERTFGPDDEDGSQGPLISDDFDDDIRIGEFGTRVFAFAGDDDIRFDDDIDTQGRGMTVFAGSGDDTVILGDGDDSVFGGLGADTIISSGGADEISAGYGNDIINVTDASGDAAAADTVSGGFGDDTITGDNGDVLLGETGVDNFFVDLANPSAAAVRIGDFDPATEVITGEITLAQDAPVAVNFVDVPSEGATYVFVEGNHAMTIVGVQSSDLNATNVNIYNTNVSG